MANPFVNASLNTQAKMYSRKANVGAVAGSSGEFGKAAKQVAQRFRKNGQASKR